MSRSFICLFIVAVTAFGRPEGEKEMHFDRRRVAQESEIIDTILNGYNPEVRPIGNVLYEGFHRPVVVTVSIHIRSFERVDDIKMQYDMQVILRQKWRDDRLAYTKEGPDSVTLKDHHKIWIPDTFFGNEDEARRHMLEQPNILIRIKRDGSVFYSTRLSLTIFCPMHFSKFPFDNQTCSFVIESYAYTEDDIVYAWDKDTPIKYAKDYAAPLLFNVENITYEGGSTKVNQHTYSFIKALFHLQRKLTYYFCEFYIPTAMLVVVSWLAFFLHPSKATARTLIGLSTLAVLTILVALIKSDVPKTSYTKAMDIWAGLSLFLVFLSLVETVIVSRLHSAQHECCDALISDPEEQLITPASKWNARKRQKSLLRKICAIFKGRGRKVDLISRLLFPLLFLVFALLYFVVYWLIL